MEVQEQLLLMHAFQHPGQPVLQYCPERILSTSTSLTTSWESYFASLSPGSPRPYEHPLNSVMIQHTLSIPLTILAALKRFGWKEDGEQEFVVHVIDAELEYEFEMGVVALEEILHFLPNVKVLKVVFVGTGMEAAGVVGELDSEALPLCAKCEEDGH
ncbi:hypothetical protein MNV49_005681 [Pseudohyphozyma bogoriensis]|nr:hypothetical protein MNV49_005681 [Pseudohyphozyma bogoriensis]